MTFPHQIVIFGASGDLTSRKLVPALLRNYAAGAIPAQTQVIGVSRGEKTTDGWRAELASALSGLESEVWPKFSPNFHWISADVARAEQIEALGAGLEALMPGAEGRLYYLALGPELFAPVVENLSRRGLLGQGIDGGPWRRVVLEKPFGHDLPSARALNHALSQWLREEQVFRIDHYLGKETVQNILAFRFQNAIFEPLWNRNHIESVEISVCEKVGTWERATSHGASGFRSAGNMNANGRNGSMKK